MRRPSSRERFPSNCLSYAPYTSTSPPPGIQRARREPQLQTPSRVAAHLALESQFLESCFAAMSPVSQGDSELRGKLARALCTLSTSLSQTTGVLAQVSWCVR